MVWRLIYLYFQGCGVWYCESVFNKHNYHPNHKQTDNKIFTCSDFGRQSLNVFAGLLWSLDLSANWTHSVKDLLIYLWSKIYIKKIQIKKCLYLHFDRVLDLPGKLNYGDLCSNVTRPWNFHLIIIPGDETQAIEKKLKRIWMKTNMCNYVNFS